MPFGIANGKSQIPTSGICNLRSENPSASEDAQVCFSLTGSAGECGIRLKHIAQRSLRGKVAAHAVNSSTWRC
jgi:hypothetical protein